MTYEARLRGLLERLLTAEVDFVLVGALAVNAWGYIRATRDIDIVPNPEGKNLDKLIAALEEIRGRVKVGDDLLGPESVRVFVHARDKAYVVTELGDVDVLQGLPQIPGYDELDAAANDADLGGLQVRVCSLEHLVAMKRASDRPLDRIDLEALKSAHPEAFEGS
ncbi:MAG: hypothetical protein ACRDL6_01310 [Solirubrobacterales bacterium]